MLQGLVFSCTHLSLFHFSVSCLLNQLTAQQLTPRIHPEAVVEELWYVHVRLQLLFGGVGDGGWQV